MKQHKYFRNQKFQRKVKNRLGHIPYWTGYVFISKTAEPDDTNVFEHRDGLSIAYSGLPNYNNFKAVEGHTNSKLRKYWKNYDNRIIRRHKYATFSGKSGYKHFREFAWLLD